MSATAQHLRILLADAHPLYREALARLIRHSDGWELVAEAADWPEAKARARELGPDLVLLAVNLPGLREGLPTPKLLRSLGAANIILVLDGTVAAESLEVICSGECDYISKNWDERQIRERIRAAAEAARPGGELAAAVSTLTAREREIVQLITEGDSNADIARDLSISLSTVKSHVAQIMRKLRTQNRAQTVARVLEVKRSRRA